MYIISVLIFLCIFIIACDQICRSDFHWIIQSSLGSQRLIRMVSEVK